MRGREVILITFGDEGSYFVEIILVFFKLLRSKVYFFIDFNYKIRYVFFGGINFGRLS